MDLPERRGHDLDVREFDHDLVDHPQERRRIERRFSLYLGAPNAEALLEILLVADQHVRVRNDPAEDLSSLARAAPDAPELLPVVEIEARDRTGLLRGLHCF